ncbi:hypothetical protein B0H16DRAFT_1658272 [Mycena metata]|uniref:FAD/NAD(P)-binding domain-containing protein n=1 Tax=Mycena metata TaxID=1033252 RepID=A0AAD7KC70_9AGAR|nr:hypothetical protein B0H16DRAFT_1658272 [Mycena metata]
MAAVSYNLPPKEVPAGSYAASVLAREGISVTVLEAAKFPRYHVGESLIPSIRHYMRFIGADEKLASFGFVRSEFDHLLMNHARASGASVYEQTKVTSISFSSADAKRPVSVSWSHVPPPSPPSPPASPTTCKTIIPEAPLEPAAVTGTTTFTHLVDATGRAGLMSTGYLKNRHFNSSLKNIAVWGYWRGGGIYGVGTPREGAPWAWFIPLHNGRTSIGVVMNQKVYNEKLKHNVEPTYFPFFLYPESYQLQHGIVKLVGTGAMEVGSVKSATDFSYSAPSYGGCGYRIIGDAGAFAVAADWHTKRVSTSYTRFQVVVLSAYKQIRNSQSVDVLSDIDEDNFDRAFSFLRPGSLYPPVRGLTVIQGASDMGKLLSETELQKSLDFCVNLFNPTSPDQSLLDVTAPLVDPIVLEHALHVEHKPTSAASTPPPTRIRLNNRDRSASEVAETRMVLNKINARRVVHAEYAINNFESEPIAGYVVRLEKHRLGLTRYGDVSPPLAE